jgi:hypothetical protein
MINNPPARESISDSHSLILTTKVMNHEVSEDQSGNANSIKINKNKTIENYKSRSQLLVLYGISISDRDMRK